MDLDRTPDNAAPKLLDQVRRLIRTKHMTRRTEKAYVAWIEKFLRFERQRQGDWRHPNDLASVEVNRFLFHLAVEQHVAVSTQSSARRRYVSP